MLLHDPLLFRVQSLTDRFVLTAEGDPAAGGGSGGGAGATEGGGGEAVKRPALGDDGTGGDGGAGEGEGGAGGTPSWREDWRESLAGGDEKELARLKRFASIENYHKSNRELLKKFSAGQTGSTLPDDAKPEEIAAYRKAAGIPEAPEGYGLAYPETMKPTEADAAVLGEFQKHMHAAHVPPAAAKAAFDFYLKNMGDGATAKAEAIQQATAQNLAEVRSAMPGAEFKRNMTLTQDFLAKHFDGSEQALDTVLDAVVMSEHGPVKIRNYAPFLKGFAGMARSYADDEALIGGDGAGGGKNIDDEYKDLVTKSVGPTRLTAAEQTRLTQLAEARAKRDHGRAA